MKKATSPAKCAMSCHYWLLSLNWNLKARRRFIVGIILWSMKKEKLCANERLIGIEKEGMVEIGQVK
nr:hypothetical protein [Providencia stuartii]